MGDGKGTNPEELLGAVHAGCFSMDGGWSIHRIDLETEALVHFTIRSVLRESLFMLDKSQDSSVTSQQREKALSRWENEGGAVPFSTQVRSISGEVQSEVPHLTNAELVQLRIRVIALENLVITLLAGASDQQLDLAREMAAYISPRPGVTHHPLTIHAAAQMIDLIARTGHFRATTPGVADITETRHRNSSRRHRPAE